MASAYLLCGKTAWLPDEDTTVRSKHFSLWVLSPCFLLALGLNGSVSMQAAQADSEDPGASGVIDGSDVRQFLDSGARFNPTRMEEASRRFDKMIKMPPRLRRSKNWQEVIQRDENLKIKPTQTTVIPAQPNGAGSSAVNQTGGAGQAAAGQATAANSASGSGTVVPASSTTTKPKEKHHLIKQVGRGIERAAEVVGFPIADEPLPGTVDASLAGDLPDGEDPRVYVHPKVSDKEKKAREEFLERAETRGASAEDVIPQGNNQPPAIIVE